MDTKEMKKITAIFLVLLFIVSGLTVWVYSEYMANQSTSLEPVVPLPPMVKVEPYPEAEPEGNPLTQSNAEIFDEFDRIIEDRIIEDRKDTIYATGKFGKKFVCTKNTSGVVEAWFFREGAGRNSTDLLPADQFKGSGPNPTGYCDRMFRK